MSKLKIVSVYLLPGKLPTWTVIDLAGGLRRIPIRPAPLYFCDRLRVRGKR